MTARLGDSSLQENQIICQPARLGDSSLQENQKMCQSARLIDTSRQENQKMCRPVRLGDSDSSLLENQKMCRPENIDVTSLPEKQQKSRQAKRRKKQKKCRPARVGVVSLHENLLCPLCGGYLIDATTLTDCLHSFCRGCILYHLQTKSYCPVCLMNLDTTDSNQVLRYDRILQRLVYKLVPGLYQNELEKRRNFTAANPGQDRTLVSLRKRNSRPYIYTGNENFSICLQRQISFPIRTSKSNAIVDDAVEFCRFLLCPASANVLLLKKFIRLKLGLSLDWQVIFFHNGENLLDDYTLLDVAYIMRWDSLSPLLMNYFLLNPTFTGVQLVYNPARRPTSSKPVKRKATQVQADQVVPKKKRGRKPKLKPDLKSDIRPTMVIEQMCLGGNDSLSHNSKASHNSNVSHNSNPRHNSTASHNSNASHNSIACHDSNLSHNSDASSNRLVYPRSEETPQNNFNESCTDVQMPSCQMFNPVAILDTLAKSVRTDVGDLVVEDGSVGLSSGTFGQDCDLPAWSYNRAETFPVPLGTNSLSVSSDSSTFAPESLDYCNLCPQGTTPMQVDALQYQNNLYSDIQSNVSQSSECPQNGGLTENYENPFYMGDINQFPLPGLPGMLYDSLNGGVRLLGVHGPMADEVCSSQSEQYFPYSLQDFFLKTGLVKANLGSGFCPQIDSYSGIPNGIGDGLVSSDPELQSNVPIIEFSNPDTSVCDPMQANVNCADASKKTSSQLNEPDWLEPKTKCVDEGGGTNAPVLHPNNFPSLSSSEAIQQCSILTTTSAHDSLAWQKQNSKAATIDMLLDRPVFSPLPEENSCDGDRTTTLIPPSALDPLKEVPADREFECTWSIGGSSVELPRDNHNSSVPCGFLNDENNLNDVCGTSTVESSHKPDVVSSNIPKCSSAGNLVEMELAASTPISPTPGCLSNSIENSDHGGGNDEQCPTNCDNPSDDGVVSINDRSSSVPPAKCFKKAKVDVCSLKCFETSVRNARVTIADRTKTSLTDSRNSEKTNVLSFAPEDLVTSETIAMDHDSSDESTIVDRGQSLEKVTFACSEAPPPSISNEPEGTVSENS